MGQAAHEGILGGCALFGDLKARCLAVTLVLAGTLTTCAASAQEPVRFTQNVPGDSKQIVLSADQIVTWQQEGRYVVLLRGTVLVEQGVVHATMQSAVGWIDPQRNRATGVNRLDLYGEGSVSLENGPKTQDGGSAILQLNTRGEMRLNALQQPVLRTPMPTDPLYQRARSIMAAVLPAALPIQRAAQQQPLPPPPTPTPTPVLPPSQQTPPVFRPANQTTPPTASPAPASSRPSGWGAATMPIPSSTPVTGATASAISTVQYSPVPNQTWPAPGAAPYDPAQNQVPVQPPLAPPQTMPYSPPSGPATAVAPVPQAAPAPGVAAQTVPAQPPPGRRPASAPGPPVAAAPGTPKQLSVVPRGQTRFQYETIAAPNGEQALVVTGGVIVTVTGAQANGGLLDIEADRVVIWSKGDVTRVVQNTPGPQGQSSSGLELYLSGNVEIREQQGPESRRLSADEVYYDVDRNVAVAHLGDLEIKQPGLPDPLHLRADRLERLSETQFRAVKVSVYSSRLPSDPELRLAVSDGTLDERRVPKRSIFGVQQVDRRTGQPEYQQQNIFHGDNVVFNFDNVPFFYLPFIQGDANDPLGPLRSVSTNYNRIFGFQLLTTFNVYDLIGIDPQPGTRWDLDLDYLSARGPAIGTEFDYAGNTGHFDLGGRYNGLIKAYGIIDHGTDDLGGGLGSNVAHPQDRGRFLWRERWELSSDITLQYQASLISDTDFMRQYFQNEHDTDVNQDTYVYLRQEHGSWAWDFLVQAHVRDWVTEPAYLPLVDGYLIGQTVDLPVLNLFTYNAHASATYARLDITGQPPPPYEPTDVDVRTARLDYMQELSLPFTAGPFRLVPYAVTDFAFYSEDVNGDERGRAYEAGGLRGSIPLTRLYPDVKSDLFNLDGIDHKIVFGWNYYYAHSDTPYSMLPQIDRLNDDATDQSLRDIHPLEAAFNPQFGAALEAMQVGGRYDPQTYAIRRLVFSRIDTLDSIDELELDLRQRWQTKRGYPGSEHIIDWITLDLSATYFPEDDRDNFGQDWAFLQYDFTWNIGDRTALVSDGWVDPGPNGVRMFSVGAFLNRPDRTSFYVGYRTIEELQSNMVSTAVTYVFSPKYAMTASLNYDFTTNPNVISGMLVLTRVGSDLQVSAGITYNSTLNTVGAVFEIVPNLLPANRRVPGLTSFGSGGLGH